MIFYFRTKMKSKQALDGDGKPIKGKTEFTMPEEVPGEILARDISWLNNRLFNAKEP